MTGYRICGELGVFTVVTPAGPAKTTMYKGAVVPDTATAAEVRHHLSVGLIEPVAGSEPEPAVSPTVVPSPDDDGGQPPQDSVPADDPERVKAREKLPADGAAPHRNAAEATWIEYAVAKGYSYDAARQAGKQELIGLLTQTS